MAQNPHFPPSADPAHVIEAARALIASLLAGGTKPAGIATCPSPLDRPLPAEPECGLATAPGSVPGHDFL